MEGKTSDTFDLVTIFYEGDIDLMKLQARSIARHLRPASLGSVLAIANGPGSDTLAQYFRDAVAPEYGDVRHRLQVYDGNALSRSLSRTSGWRSQQLLKLLASRVVTSSSFVILDAKNHLIRECGQNDFLEVAGRPVSHYVDNSFSLRMYFEGSFRSFDLDELRFTAKSPPQTTPFPVLRSTIAGLIDEIERRSGQDFDTYFTSTPNVSEFFLISAFVIHRDGYFEKEFAFRPRYSINLFVTSLQQQSSFERSMSHLRDPEVKICGMHHTFLAALDAARSERVARVWLDAGLISDLSEGLQLLMARRST